MGLFRICYCEKLYKGVFLKNFMVIVNLRRGKLLFFSFLVVMIALTSFGVAFVNPATGVGHGVEDIGFPNCSNDQFLERIGSTWSCSDQRISASSCEWKDMATSLINTNGSVCNPGNMVAYVNEGDISSPSDGKIPTGICRWLDEPRPFGNGDVKPSRLVYGSLKTWDFPDMYGPGYVLTCEGRGGGSYLSLPRASHDWCPIPISGVAQYLAC